MQVKVVTKKDFDLLDAAGQEDVDTFFCRYHYDSRTKKVIKYLNPNSKPSHRNPNPPPPPCPPLNLHPEPDASSAHIIHTP